MSNEKAIENLFNPNWVIKNAASIATAEADTGQKVEVVVRGHDVKYILTISSLFTLKLTAYLDGELFYWETLRDTAKVERITDFLQRLREEESLRDGAEQSRKRDKTSQLLDKVFGGDE